MIREFEALNRRVRVEKDLKEEEKEMEPGNEERLFIKMDKKGVFRHINKRHCHQRTRKVF